MSSIYCLLRNLFTSIYISIPKRTIAVGAIVSSSINLKKVPAPPSELSAPIINSQAGTKMAIFQINKLDDFWLDLGSLELSDIASFNHT